jgi:hypothetical protein
MLLTVDGQSDYTLSSNPSTLADVLLELSDTFSSQGRLLLAIVLDDQIILPEALTLSLGAIRLDGISTLEVTSASIHALVNDSLDEISEVISELPVVCHEIAVKLSSENPASCFAYFNQLLEIWEVIKDRQSQILVHVDLQPETIPFQNTTIAEHNAHLSRLIQESRTLMETSGFNASSALVEKEIVSMAQYEEALLARLRELVAG